MKQTVFLLLLISTILGGRWQKACAQNPFDLTAEAWHMLERQQPDSALTTQQKAIKAFQKQLGERHSQVGVAYKNMAEMCSVAGRPKDAIRYGLMAADIVAEWDGDNSHDYAEQALALARYYDDARNFPKAIEWGEKALTYYEDAFPPNPRNLGTAQSNLTWYYADAGDYVRAIDLCHQAVESWTEELGSAHPYIAILMNNLAGYHAHLSNYSEAVHYDQRSMDVVMAYTDTPDTIYAAALSNMAEHLAFDGRNAQAIETGLRAAELRQQLLGTSHPKYLKTLADLASTYASIGETEEALRLQRQIVDIREQTGQTNGLAYVRSVANLAMLTAKNGDLDTAITLTRRALELDRQLGTGEQHLLTSNLALFYGQKADYDHAADVSREALKLIAKTHGKRSFYYARQLSDLSMWYERKGGVRRAIRYGCESIDLFQQLYGPDNDRDLTTRNNLAQLYASQQQYYKALSTLSPAADKAAEIMLRNFTGLSSQQRNHYWNKYSGMLTHLLPLFTLKAHHKQSGHLYNLSALFAKSLLLNTELELTRLIMESGDQQLVDDYYHIQALKSQLENERTLPRSQRSIDADSLQSDISRREAALSQASSAYGNYCRNLNICWQDVQQKLRPEDIAIEFLSFPDDTIRQYVALTLRADYTEPHLIPVCTSADLLSLNATAYYKNTAEQNTQLCHMIWAPLTDELQGVRRVFFSPAGQLYQIGIEQLPWDSVSIAAEHYDFYRLSSTRELCMTGVKNEDLKVKTAVLYGGLAYDIILPEENEPLQSEQEEDAVSRGMVKTLRRHLFSYLKNTQVEVDSISEMLGNCGIDCLMFTNEEGTEQTLKQLSGQHIDMLHVATHGQYVPAEQAEQLKQQLNLRFLQTVDDNEQMLVEDFSLSHSLLAMSGANTLLGRIDDSNAQRTALGDGVLTAGEISRIDLRGLQLVVLSACQTGLGDVTNEGVMGLQRGFKKAGAQTILMSLWPVNDRATAQLMQTFYEHLMEGANIRRAFLAAQSDLRRRYASTPNAEQLWGAFILLDALE